MNRQQSSSSSSAVFNTPPANHASMRQLPGGVDCIGNRRSAAGSRDQGVNFVRNPPTASVAAANVQSGLQLPQRIGNRLIPSTAYPSNSRHPAAASVQQWAGHSADIHFNPLFGPVAAPQQSVPSTHPWLSSAVYSSYSPLLYQIQPSASAPARSSSSGISSVQSGASANDVSRDDLSQSEDFGDSLIDFDTPEPISEMLLGAIQVKPYMLEEETRSPEVFVDHYETYADLLKLNDEQRRVFFAGLAYRDDNLCFQALKFDTTYEDMKRNFLDMARKNIVKASLEKIAMGVVPKKSGVMKRVRKWFCK